MPFGGLLSLAGPLISGGSALMGLLGSGSPAQNAMPAAAQYNFANMGMADQNAFNMNNSLGNYNVAGATLPQYQAIAQSAISNPYASLYQGGANQTGAAMYGGGAGLAGTALSTLPDVQALLSLGFDPQQALYGKLQNQNAQQNAAMLGQRGVANTPYGAGVAADANTNFNINWENAQLQRAIQGASGAGGLLTNASNNAGAGFGMMQQGAGLPYNTFQGINATNLNTLGQLGQFGQQAGNQANQQIQNYLDYLRAGAGQQGANNQSSQASLNQANAVFNQNSQMGNQLGQALTGLGKGWGNAFGSGSGGPGNWTMTGGPGVWNFPMAA